MKGLHYFTMFLIFIFLAIFSFFSIVNFRMKTSNVVYKNDSLCSSLLGNVKYYSDRDLCSLPCSLINSNNIITKSDNKDCPILAPSISIQNDKIKALMETEVSQYIREQCDYKVDTVRLHQGQTIDIKSEVIRTVPNFTTNRFDWFLKFIPKKVDRLVNNTKLSVHLFMLDAASRYVARKQLSNTVKTLQSLSSQYSTFDMLRYHTVGANSNPHFPPIFYGVNDTEARNINKIILEDFKEEGYITINAHEFIDPKEKLYGENKYKGSDHNINYICEDPIYNNVGGEGQYGHHARCVGHKQIHKYVFEYLKESVNYYHIKNYPTFALTILSDSHDYRLMSLPRIDKDLSDYISFLHKENILNTSILFFFSDHGLHYGGYYASEFGKADHSLPLLFGMFPKWFIQKYPAININMRTNQNRFVTAFDFHSTLFDIAHFRKNKKNIQNKRGISLFKSIPKNRSCHDFHVVYGCSCNMTQEYLNIP